MLPSEGRGHRFESCRVRHFSFLVWGFAKFGSGFAEISFANPQNFRELPLDFAKCLVPEAPPNLLTLRPCGPPEGIGCVNRVTRVLNAAVNGSAGDDPRSISLGAVAEGLCRIIEVEGPMIAKRAYDIYLRGCGIKRLGPELRSTMNKALSSAIRQGKLVSENDADTKGVIFSTVRIKGTPRIKIRTRGPRLFSEIPPDELRAVGQYISANLHVQPGTDEHLRLVLDHFDLRRLTTQVGTAILEILDKKSNPDTELFEQ